MIPAADRFNSWDRSTSLPTVLTVLIALSGLIVFFLIRNILERLAWSTDYVLPASILALVGAAVFARVGYDQLPGIFSVLARTTAAGILTYLIFERPDFTLADSSYAHLAAYVDRGYWVALAVAALSIWRPSFMYPAAFYVIATRYVVDEISGFYMSILDIRYMVDMAQFLAMSACGIALIRMWRSRRGKRSGPRVLGMVDLRLLALCLAFIAMGFHLGNYFWSGFAKVVLGPQPWSWMLENQTQNLMIGALKRGTLPSGALPGLTQMLFDGSGHVVLLSNILVLATQLFAVIAVLRLRWLRIASWAYDGLHIGIYIFGGLFFWPWIWNNLSIFLAISRRSEQEIGWAPKLCCIIAILLGGSQTLGASARLGWWDVLDIKVPTIQAQAEDNSWVDVPASYFLSHSYTVSHGWVDLAKTQGHYLPTIWGCAYTYDRLRTSGTCPEPPFIEEVESPRVREERLARVARFIRAHHRKMAQYADENKHYNFYLRSHHHPSNPWMYEKFNDMDIRKIRRYRLLTQSVCMSISEGRLVERIIKEDAIEFEIDG